MGPMSLFNYFLGYPSVYRMIKYIKDKKVVTKADLIEKTGWGRGIKFSPYRKALTDHANIFDKMGILWVLSEKFEETKGSPTLFKG